MTEPTLASVQDGGPERHRTQSSPIGATLRPIRLRSGMATQRVHAGTGSPPIAAGPERRAVEGAALLPDISGELRCDQEIDGCSRQLTQSPASPWPNAIW
jgi:hypothetical protein